MNASFYAGLEHILTKPHLSVYRQDGADDTTALACYLYNIALCRELYAPLHIFEVSMRNAIDEALCIFSGVPTGTMRCLSTTAREAKSPRMEKA